MNSEKELVKVYDQVKGLLIATVKRKPLTINGLTYYRYKGKIHKAFIVAGNTNDTFIILQDWI